MGNPATDAVDNALTAAASQSGTVGDFARSIRLSIASNSLLWTIIVVLVLVVVTLTVHKAAAHVMLRIERRMRDAGNTSAALVGFVRHIVSFFIYFIGGISIIGCFPALEGALNRVLATGGVLAVVIGIASQEALGSMVSGIMILLFRPFVLGDAVRYVDNGIAGVIEEISVHHTTIRTYENKRVIIPNSKMNAAIIENADYGEKKVCAFLEVHITYESDIELAKKLLADEIKSHETFLDYRTDEQKAAGEPPVVVRVVELADSAIILRAWLWARDNGTAFAMQCDVKQRIKSRYDDAGVELAYPHLVVVQK